MKQVSFPVKRLIVPRACTVNHNIKCAKGTHAACFHLPPRLQNPRSPLAVLTAIGTAATPAAVVRLGPRVVLILFHNSPAVELHRHRGLIAFVMGFHARKAFGGFAETSFEFIEFVFLVV